MNNIKNFKIEDHPFGVSNLFYTENILYQNKPLSKFFNNINFYKNFLDSNVKTIQNEFNNNGYRCDNFIDNHAGLHILFSGCSNTFGSGLEIEDVWAKKVYNKISKNIKCSGYFNLAMPASSIVNQIIDIFKYCKTYGNPNIIFINIPQLFRFYGIDKKNKNFIDSIYYNDENYQNLLNLISFQYYFMLDQYCSTNKIQLFSFTWFNLSKKNMPLFINQQFKIFNTFYPFDNRNLEQFIVKYKEKNINDKFAEIARDGIHVGTAYQQYWADFIYKKFLTNNKIMI